MPPQSSGRIVLNHSTHIPGLIAILERLSKYAGVQTITPGVIGNVKGHTPRMTLRVSVPIRGGFKLLARQGKTVQEVFIITSMDRTDLEAAIVAALKLK